MEVSTAPDAVQHDPGAAAVVKAAEPAAAIVVATPETERSAPLDTKPIAITVQPVSHDAVTALAEQTSELLVCPSPMLTKTSVTEVDFTEYVPMPILPDPVETALAVDPIDASYVVPACNAEATVTDTVKAVAVVLENHPARLSLQQRKAYAQHLDDAIAHLRKLNCNTSDLKIVAETLLALVHADVPCLSSILPLVQLATAVSPPLGDKYLLNLVEILHNRISAGAVIKAALGILVDHVNSTNIQALVAARTLNALGSITDQHGSDAEIQFMAVKLLNKLSKAAGTHKPIMDRFVFQVCNYVNYRYNEIAFAEQGFELLTTLAISSESVATILTTGVLATVKSVLTDHAQTPSVLLCAIEFLMCISSYDRGISALFDINLDASLNAARINFPEIKPIVTKATILFERITEFEQANSPEAIVHRLNTRILHQGYLNKISGWLNRAQKRWFILQPSQFSYYNSETDDRQKGVFKLRDITHIQWDPEAQPFTLVLHLGKGDVKHLETVDRTSAEEWFKHLRAAWKLALSPVFEAPQVQPEIVDRYKRSETVSSSDVDKVIVQHMLAELALDPFVITHKFKNPMTKDGASAADFFQASTARKLTNEFKSRLAEFAGPALGEKSTFYVEAMKLAIDKLVESRSIAELAAFDANENACEAAPHVLTTFEYCAKQGFRPTMEDRHAHVPFVDVLLERSATTDPVSFYAVFDGHGGITAADYCESHLLPNIVRHPDFETDTKKAISAAFMSTQEDLRHATIRNGWADTAGCTAVVVLFKGKKMFVAWAGDSEAVLVKKGQEAVALVDTHKPSKESERQRIEKLGGFVSESSGIPRVMNAVAVSRAFGNFRHNVINPEPTIAEHELTGDEEYLLIACDGLWDVTNAGQIRSLVDAHMTSNRKSPPGRKWEGVSETLVQGALNSGSGDNVSAIFVPFLCWK